MTPDTDFSVGIWTILGLPLAEAILIGALGGLVGCLAVLNQRIFFTESVTHATFPGAVLGVVAAGHLLAGVGDRHTVLSLSLFVGAALACLPMAWLMHLIAKVPGQSSQAAAGIVLTLGFALGYFLAKWFQPLPLKIEGFLAGSILSVNRTDVISAGVVLALAVLVTAVAGRRLVFYAFDGSGYRATGMSGGAASGVILVLIVAAVVVLIPAVGTILPVALIAAPAAALAPMLRSWRTLVLLAPVAGMLISVTGLWLGVILGMSSGGMIALVAGVFYVAVAGLRKLLPARRPGVAAEQPAEEAARV
ncbi:metal ABC transporter permease [Corynebacterium sphenisci]|uniref:metal ABC transporter permease n=1 Tax=Corynebacterium sphenisci TaxID=191493 RepID=UPI000950EAD7|nr:metal ABC transporter permease [Corynebacterium sphenisci]